jgi:hypothetical protein
MDRRQRPAPGIPPSGPSEESVVPAELLESPSRVKAASAEMQGAFKRLYPEFYVVAIVGADNKPSQRVAEQVISNTAVSVTDQISGLPAFRYVRKVEPPTSDL